MSDLSQSARDYLALRQSLGHKLVMAACLLPRFVEYLDAAGMSAVTVEASLACLLGPIRTPICHLAG